jgi:hypothetical protein
MLGQVASATDNEPAADVDTTAAVDHLERAVGRAAATGDLATEVGAMSQLALISALLGDAPEARRLFADAIERAERLGNPTIAAVAYGLAVYAFALIGTSDEVTTMFEQGLAHADVGGPLVAMTHRVQFALITDDPHQAARVLLAALPIAKDQLSGYHQSFPLLAAAAIAAGRNNDLVAARLLGAWSHQGGFAGPANERMDAYGRLLQRLTDRLGAATLEAELGRGAQLSIPNAFCLAEEVVVAASAADPGTIDP